jgi:hypothetical protein
MTPPISIDGTDITGATIDGTDVTEITVDGDTVFSAGPEVAGFGTLYCYYSARLETSLSNGDPVTTLTDHSGNGHDMTKVGGATVTYNSNGLGGQPEFDMGSGAFFESTSLTISTPTTFAMVFDSSANSTLQILMSKDVADFQVNHDTGQFNDLLGWKMGGAGTFERGVSSTSPMSYVGIWKTPGNNVELRKDGASLNPLDSGETSPSASATGWYLGGRDNDTFPFKGTISEIFWYDGNPTVADIENYLSNTFGTF